MTQLSKNVIANVVGKLFTGLLALGLIPLYVRLMGVESYGLVGMFATFQAAFLLLDMGLSTTLNRELARLSKEAGPGEARDLVRTMELPYWGASGVILIAAWPLGSLIATHWVHPCHLSHETTRNACVLMSVAVGLQFPFTLYSGGLMGLQRQVVLNAILIGVAIVRGLGAVAVLCFLRSDIEAFLSWQLLVSALQTLVTWRLLWANLPSANGSPRVRKELLVGKLRFAGGVVAVSTVSVILMQMDKILLSKILSLEQFAYYAMASSAAGAVGVIVSPLFSAVFPRFSQLADTKDSETLKHLYHKSCQVMAVLVLPPAIMLAMFSREVMFIWTQNHTTAEQTCRLVSLLVVGTALNGLMSIPYALQLAHGWTKLATIVNIIAIIVLIPLLLFLSYYWGALGAALVWPILNAGYVLFSLQLMHRRLLSGELWRWYWADLGLPLGATLIVTAMVRLVLPDSVDLGWLIAALAVTGLSAQVAAGLASGYVRRMCLALFRNWWSKGFIGVS